MVFRQSDGTWQVYLRVPTPRQWVNLGNYKTHDIAALVFKAGITGQNIGAVYPGGA